MLIISTGPGRKDGAPERTLHFTERSDLLVAARGVGKFGAHFTEADLILRSPSDNDRTESEEEALMRQEAARGIADEIRRDILSQHARALRGYDIGDVLFRNTDSDVILGSIDALGDQDFTSPDLSDADQHFILAARHLAQGVTTEPVEQPATSVHTA